MIKTWVFFKLRMLQLRYDKTALIFSYIFPVLLLTGIGYPIEMAGKQSIELYYADHLSNDKSKALINYLDSHDLVSVVSYTGAMSDFKSSLIANEFNHFLLMEPTVKENVDSYVKVMQEHPHVTLYSDDSSKHLIQSMALGNILNQFFNAEQTPSFIAQHFQAGSISSYIAILLPGLIGMTLLTIGLNGFGAVLMGESLAGLFKNIKTIEASPVPFLAGLFLTRLLVSYTVAVALYMVGIFMFGLTTNIDIFLLLVVVTLGCVSFLGIGLVIAVLSPSETAFYGIVNFIQFPFVILSGVFFSIAAFPDWLQTVSQFIPLTHMNSAMKAILFDQINVSSISEIFKELLVLILWCSGTILLGCKKFKW